MDELRAAGIALRKCLWQESADAASYCTVTAGVFLRSADWGSSMLLPDGIHGPCAAVSRGNHEQGMILGNGCVVYEVLIGGFA